MADKNQAEKLQKELKAKYIASKCTNDEENERYSMEQAELKQLRRQKIDLGKKKDLSEKECQKLSNELQQAIVDRKDLEKLAKKLS